MGTGKSTVGKLVAEALGLAFVDMDEEIVRRTGMPVTDIFAQQGEAGFRELESALAGELGAREGMVISTGGGTVLRVENKAALSTNGLIVCLTCSPDEILRRVAQDTGRPLLEGEDKAGRIAALLAKRAAAYLTVPVVIDTTYRTIAEVVDAVVKAYQDETCKPSTLP
jgi:shikimate kinase